VSRRGGRRGRRRRGRGAELDERAEAWELLVEALQQLVELVDAHLAREGVGERRACRTGRADHAQLRGHETLPRSRQSCARRLAMTSQYRSSSSTPIAFRPRFRAATSVAPDPANGSSTVPPG
jgi:hypothetical protein